MSEEQNIRELMREGIEAARAGDKATARDRFEQVTELDENNEKAWFWLASVVESDEEKRVCLNNVLVINPDNERAQQILDRLNREKAMEEEVVPGIPRRQLMMIAGGGGLVVIVLLIVVLIVIMNERNREAAQRTTAETVTAQVVAQNATQTSMAETQIALEASQTPTPRLNVLPTELPPTETPTPTATEFRLPPPPSEVTGDIVAWGGRDVLSNGALEPRHYPVASGGEFTLIGDELGRDVRFAGDNTRIVYTRYFPSTFDFGLEAVNINGTQSQPIQTSASVLGARQPDHCAVANRVVFAAVPLDAPTSNEALDFDQEPASQLYIIDLDRASGGDPASAIIRLTNDAAHYQYPAFSPDCSRIVAIRNNINSAEPGNDIFVIDVESRSLTPVTTDLTTFAETRPRWSPDGTQIVFAAAQANTPDNHDIFLINADGSGVPAVLMRGDSDDAYPVISPNGEYLAFSSDRTGEYNIFITRLFSNEVWQLTPDTGRPVFVGGWK